MIKRANFLILAIGIALASVVSPLIISSPAKAWYPTDPLPPVCATSFPISAVDTAIDTQDSGFNPSYLDNWTSSSTITDFASVLIFQKSADVGQNKFWIYFAAQNTDTAKTIEFIKNTANSAPSVYAVKFTQSNVMPTVKMYYDGVTPSTSFFALGSQTTTESDIACIATAENEQYNATWDLGQVNWSLTTDGSYSQPSCEALDIGCWIGGFFNGIGDGFNAVGRAIVSGIASLFIPDSDSLADQFDSLSTSLSDHLGFLAFPITFIADLLGEILSATSYDVGVYGSGACNLEFAGGGSSAWLWNGGYGFVTNFCTIEDEMPTVWTTMQTLLIAATVWTLFAAFHRKYLEVVRA